MSTGNPLPCTFQAIHNFALQTYGSKCEYVIEACQEQASTVDFFKFYYCTLEENHLIFILFAILFFFVAFYWISTTAEDYLEPALSNIAEKFHFSESLAGITLVSLANGAPDVFSAFAAGSLKEEGVLFPLGGLLGGGIFASSVVLAACILSSKSTSIQAEPRAFNRDSLFYVFSVVYLLVLGIYGEINFAGSIGFCAIYGTFIGAVIYNEAMLKKRADAQELEDEMYQEDGEICILYDYDEEAQTDLEGLVKHDYIVSENTSTGGDSETITKKRGETNQQLQMNKKLSSYSKERYNNPNFSLTRLQWRYYKLKKNLKKEMREMREKSLFGKVLSLISIPYKIISTVTIPASNSAQYHKTITMIQPFTVSLFLFWQFGMLEILTDTLSLSFYLFICTALSLFIWKTTRSGQLPEGHLGFFLLFASFIASATWLNLVAHTIIDFVSLLSIFTGLPLNYLGLTLLAWGNSLPDLYVDMALVKKGLDQTALSGIFGGQFFNFVIGFGVSILRQVLTFGPRKFQLLETSQTATINLILIWWLVLKLAGIVIYTNKNNYKLYRNSAIYLIGLYIVFFVLVTSMIL